MRRWRSWMCGAAVGAALAGQASALSRFESRSFGFNLSQSLINPLEAGGSETALRQEVAAILYDVRMGGGQVVRWNVTDVWPQWRCGSDPEDQSTGGIDPAWYTVSRVLLQEAARQHVTVVVSLTNLTSDEVPGKSAALVNTGTPRQSVSGQAKHGLGSVDSCVTTPGYYGQNDQASLFNDARLLARLKQRVVEMGRYLAAFPALGAIELFNEPKMSLTATYGYWDTVQQLRQAIHGASAGSAHIPVISGTAAWSYAIVDAARNANALGEEPFITVHAYDDYTQKTPGASVRAMLAYQHRLIADKAVVVAEIGGKVPVRTLREYRRMLDIIMSLYLDSSSGFWVWGNWFEQPKTADFAMDFNHRSAIGPAFRPYFFADREAEYAEPRVVQGFDPTSHEKLSVALRIHQAPPAEVDPAMGGSWVITVGKSQFVGLSRAGVFSRPYLGAPSRFADPPPTLFLSERGEELRWASVGRTKTGWELSLFECVQRSGPVQPGDFATPDELLGLATDQHRADLARCLRSRMRLRATI